MLDLDAEVCPAGNDGLDLPFGKVGKDRRRRSLCRRAGSQVEGERPPKGISQAGRFLANPRR